MATGEYRKFLPDLSTSRFVELARSDAHDHVRAFHEHQRPPWLHALYQYWQKLFEEPFKGLTSDGSVKTGLFSLQDEDVSIAEIVAAAADFLGSLNAEQKTKSCYHIDSPEWRSWSNPEFLFSNKGIRLDEVTKEVRDAALKVLQASLSPEGYNKARKAMHINHFLGEICQSPRVMNEYSYNIVFFGNPSKTRPWGWSFYGHHLCLNAFFYRSQMVLSPCFTGAEPNEIDRGPHSDTKILVREEILGLKLMQGLSPELQKQARVFEEMKDSMMPPGRWNQDDQRHLCGAYRDNRVVPYEGIKTTDMTEDQQTLVWSIVDEYFLYLPAQARRMQLDRCKDFAKETHFCWIGGFRDEDPFYFRIQNPVIVLEFDHHSGVFLTNQEPAKFHVHTILRTPNAGDYGSALRQLIPRDEEPFIWNLE